MNGIPAYINVFGAHVCKVSDVFVVVGNLRTNVNFSHIARLLLVLACHALACRNAAFGTSIVAFRDGRSVFIGSDSLQAHVNRDLPNTTVCKITQIAKTQFVAVASMPSGSHYDAVAIAKASAHSISVQETADAFVDSMTAPLRETIRDVLQVRNTPNGRAIYDTYISGPAPWLSVIFVGFDGRESRIESREIKVSEERGEYFLTTYKASCGTGCKGDAAIIRSGYYSGTSRAKALRLVRQNARAGIKRLIRTEIAAHPTDVGPPIDILVVERTRAYWSKGNREGCEAIY